MMPQKDLNLHTLCGTGALLTGLIFSLTWCKPGIYLQTKIDILDLLYENRSLTISSKGCICVIFSAPRFWDSLSVIEVPEGGIPNPFPSPNFFQIPLPSAQKCLSHSHFDFFFQFPVPKSQSHYPKSHFPRATKGQSQLPFYPFRTLIITLQTAQCICLREQQVQLWHHLVLN